MIWAQRRKKRGIKPSPLDFMVYQLPIYGQSELKIAPHRAAAEKAMTTDQHTTRRLLREAGCPADVSWSVLTFYQWLVEANFRLHPNARNIAIEIEARWRAAQDAADIKRAVSSVGGKKRTSRPRAPKPSARKLAAAQRANDLWRG